MKNTNYYRGSPKNKEIRFMTTLNKSKNELHDAF